MDSAISYEALLEFYHRHAECDPEMTSEQVFKIVQELTRLQSCSYAAMLPSQQLSIQPTFLVSHCTASKFALIMDGLRHELEGADPSEVFLWIDLFSVSSCLHVMALPIP
jgi:hypothetical protein